MGTYYWASYQPNKNCRLHSNANAFSDVVFATNSLGIRGPEIQLPKPKGQKRILFLGDSFMTGWGVSEQEALPQMTQTILQGALPSVSIETINAGLSASGQGYEYLFFKNDGLSLDPDVVLVGLYIFNDIADSIRESTWSQIDASGLPEKITSKSSYIDYQGNIRQNVKSLKLFVPFLKKSYLYDLITDGIIRLLPQDYIRTGEVNISCVFRENCHTFDRQKNDMKRLFLGMQKISELQRKKLIVVLLPSEVQVHPEHSNRYDIVPPLTLTDAQRPHGEFAEFFKENGINFIDLLPVFQEHAKEPLYSTLDEHWTALGNRLAAQSIADYLQSSIPSD